MIYFLTYFKIKNMIHSLTQKQQLHISGQIVAMLEVIARKLSNNIYIGN